MNFEEIVGTFAMLVLLALLITKVNEMFVNNRQISKILVKFYADKGLIVNDVYKLSFTEKLKYGVISNSILRFYSYFIPFLRINYFRKVELIDPPFTKYVEFSMSKNDHKLLVIGSLSKFCPTDEN